MVKANAVLVAAALGLVGCLATTDPGALVPPTADRDPSLPQIELRIAGHTRAVHLETYGDPVNPPLLVLHGSISDFRALRPLRVLADRYFVVFWDQRGNGLSERITADEYTFDSVVEEIDAIRARFAGDRRVTLIGHSFGAMYASLYTSRRPDRVQQLVLIEPGGLNGRIFTETYSTIIDIDLLSPELSETYWQNEVLSPSDHESMDYKALLLLENSSQTHYFCDKEHPPHYPVWRPGAFVEYMRGVRMGAGLSGGTFEFDFATGLTAFPREVLLIGSSCSALGADFQTKHHLPLFGNARVVRIENAGHRVHVEQFDALLTALQGYLTEYVTAE